MQNVALDKKVSDMTAGGLRDLIHDTVYGILDPDYGLDLLPEFEEGLKESMQQRAEGKLHSLQDVEKALGL